MWWEGATAKKAALRSKQGIATGVSDTGKISFLLVRQHRLTWSCLCFLLFSGHRSVLYVLCIRRGGSYLYLFQLFILELNSYCVCSRVIFIQWVYFEKKKKKKLERIQRHVVPQRKLPFLFNLCLGSRNRKPNSECLR